MKFSEQRWDMLKSTCALGATAIVSVGGSLQAFAATQSKGVPEIGDTFIFVDGPTSRTLPNFPVKSVDGKLVVSGVSSGYVGVKRAT